VSDDGYDQMLALADVFGATGAELRQRARLATDVLTDPDVTPSAELSPRTFEAVELALRAISTGKAGLQTRSVELDADAFVVRATVLTYRWIDELQQAAYSTLGSIAGRALGYLAPQVALGGAIVSAGLIETESLERDDVAAYLSELAEHNPELRDHLTTGGGGLVESLRMRALLTAGAPDGDDPETTAIGLRRIGVAPLPPDFAAALRDIAAAVLPSPDGEGLCSGEARPDSLAELIDTLVGSDTSVRIDRVGEGRFVVYLPGPHVGMQGLRLVGGDEAGYAARALAAISEATAGDADPRLLLVGLAQGGVTAARIAAEHHEGFHVDQVVVAGAPAAQVPRLPDHVRLLALEERTDPIALLGAMIHARDEHRVTVVFESRAAGSAAYAEGARAADAATHPTLLAELARLRQQGYLAG
jgi:hypothetical protein